MMGCSLLAAVSGRPTHDLSIFDPASPPAQEIRDLSILVFAITAGIFLVVEGILFYCVFRFRHRPAAPEPGGEPPQVYGSKPIEIAWTAAPTLIVFVLVLVTARTLWQVETKPPTPQPGDDTLFVTVIGRQWWWEYRYEYYNGARLDLVTANELHVPASEDGRPRNVRLALESADVCHSFWVPRLAGKTDLIPGRTNQTWFRTSESRVFLGQCAEYCGAQHAHMLLRVVVDTPDDFERWLENERKPAVEDPAVSDGRKAFLSHSCINCHAVRGSSARGTYAPDLTHLMSRQTLASGMIPNNPENLRAWVGDPQKIKPGCLMPNFKLSDQELDLVVRYLQTLR